MTRDVLLLGFGYEDSAFDPDSRADVERALRPFFPSAKLVEFDHHDRNADRLCAAHGRPRRSGGRSSAHRERFPPQRRVAFATADMAPREAGWIEGALVSGAAAARWAIA